jgi:hypothetical protein
MRPFCSSLAHLPALIRLQLSATSANKAIQLAGISKSREPHGANLRARPGAHTRDGLLRAPGLASLITGMDAGPRTVRLQCCQAASLPFCMPCAHLEPP